jgi:prepilin-type N-terminal cleavage/methylation domain-containing protein
MINRLTSAARKRRRQQGGFTLIELLVVITILGILAAIVSVSLLGITSKARENAKKTELQIVQAAFDTMLADQQIQSGVTVSPAANPGAPTGPLASPGVCTTSPTNDMTAFPPGGVQYKGAADPASGGAVTVLATHYLRQTKTAYLYTCDGFGTITQSGP